MKTFTTSLAAAIIAPTKEPRYLYRFFMVRSISAFAFREDFTTGDIATAQQTYSQIAGYPTGNTQTVEVEQGRSTIGTFKIPFYDIGGRATRYLSDPVVTLTASISATDTTIQSSIAGGLNAAYPPFGYVIIDDEHIAYGSVTGSTFVSFAGGRGNNGTAAVAHSSPASIGNASQIRPGAAVQIFVGDTSVTFSHYASFAVMQVIERTQPGPGLYDVTVQDLQRDLKKFAFIDAAPDTSSVTNTLTRQGNPLTLLLQVWTTTSGGGNSAYDQGDGRGAAIPAAYIAITSIEALRDSQFPNDVYRFLLREPVVVKDWSEALLKTLNCYAFVTESGDLSVKRIASSGTAVASLTMDTIVGIPKWQAGDRLIANQLAFLYDFGEADPGVYATRELFSSEASRLKYGRKPPFVIEAQGVRTANSGAAIALNRASRFFERFADPPPILQTDVHYSQLRLDIGDVITVTHSWVPNLKTGVLGLNGAVFEITDMRPIMSPFEGSPRIQLSLLHTGAADMPPLPINVGSFGGRGLPPPAVPTGLTIVGCSFVATDGTLVGFAVASWNANTEEDLWGYLGRGRRQAGNEAYFTTQIPKGSTSLRIDGLPPGVPLEGQIAAMDFDQNQSAFSSVVTFTVPGSGLTAPATVAGLTATGRTDHIFLSWTANSEKNILGYRGQRSATGSFQGEEVTAWAGNVNQYADTNLDFGLNQTFYYRGRAETTDGGVGLYGTIVNATRDTTGPGVPTGLVVTTSYRVMVDGALTGTLVASWTAPSDLDVGGYVGRVRVIGNSAFFSQRLPATPTNVELTGLVPGLAWEGQLAAVDVWGNQGAYTVMTSFTTPGSGGTLAAPTGLTATAGFRSVTLNMNPSTDTRVIGYQGWRATNSAMTTNSVSAITGLVTTFVDGDLDVANTYFYRVRAQARDGLFSAYTAVVFATPNTVGSGSMGTGAVGTTVVQAQAITTTRRQLVNQQTLTQSLFLGVNGYAFTITSGSVNMVSPSLVGGVVGNGHISLYLSDNFGHAIVVGVFNATSIRGLQTVAIDYW